MGEPLEGLRDATPSEEGILLELQRRSSWVWEEYRAALAAHPDAISMPPGAIRDGAVRVACDADGVVGFSVTLPGDGGCYELDGLFVEPTSTRRGVGRALIADIVGRAGRGKAPAIEVTANPRALEFYRRVGFRETGVVATQFGRGVRMRLDLDA